MLEFKVLSVLIKTR